MSYRTWLMDSLVRSTTSALVLGLAVRSAGQLVILILVSRVNGQLASEMVVVMAVSAPVFITAEMGLRTVFVTDPAKPDTNWFLHVRALALIGALLISGLLYEVIASEANWIVFILVVGVKCADSVADICMAPLQRLQRHGTLALLQVMNGLTTSVLAVALASVTSSGTWILIGSLLASAGTAVAAWYLGVRTHSAHSTDRALKHHSAALRAGALNGLSSGVTTLGSSIPVYVLSAAGPQSAITAYALLQYGIAAMDIVANARVTKALPQMASLVSSMVAPADYARTALRESVRWALLSLPFVPVALVGVVIAAHLSQVSDEITPLDLALVAVTMLLVQALGAYNAALAGARLFARAFGASAVGAAVTAGVTTLTVPMGGLTGAMSGLATGVGARTASAGLALTAKEVL